MIDKKTIDRVKDSADIVKTISEYYQIPLKKKGNKYWCCCPFHGERTASFSVSDVRNQS